MEFPLRDQAVLHKGGELRSKTGFIETAGIGFDLGRAKVIGLALEAFDRIHQSGHGLFGIKDARLTWANRFLGAALETVMK